MVSLLTLDRPVQTKASTSLCNLAENSILLAHINRMYQMVLKIRLLAASTRPARDKMTFLQFANTGSDLGVYLLFHQSCGKTFDCRDAK